jgi:uncharacterized membrane protein YdjX (TVP38/TMEM64 family)
MGHGLKRSRVVLGLGAVFALAALFWALRDFALIAADFNPAALESTVKNLGMWGPFALIGLMVLAVVVSPIPSVPVALAAGALYGHAWGTLYVVLGLELGALAAFGISRLAGHVVLRHLAGRRISVNFAGSQNALMGLVFFNRLLPLISFDLISYLAGLTALSWWRFAVATLAGIVPVNFLIVHFGGEIGALDPFRAMVAVLGLALLGAIPFVAGHVALKSGRVLNRSAQS